MSAPDTFYLHRLNASPIWTINLQKDEIRIITVDCSAYCGLKGTTISSSAVTSETNSIVSIASESDTDDTFQANLTAAEEGCEYVTLSATLANGEKLVQRLLVSVTEPRTARFINDYLT